MSGCLYQGVEVKARVTGGCSSGAYLIDHSTFRKVKYTGNSGSIGGSVHLTSGNSVVVTSTLFSESENYDYGACLRAQGFSFARFEWDSFLKSKTRRDQGWGQTTSLHSHTNSSLHLSNSISECSPDTNQGGFTIFFTSCTHTSIISFNNLSNNKVKYWNAWNWEGFGGEGTMNTLANNEMNRIIYSDTKANSISFTNFVGNKHSPNYNDGFLYIGSGSLDVFSSFIITNDYSSLYHSSGLTPTFHETLFYKNTFDASPTTTSLPFTHSLLGHISFL